MDSYIVAPALKVNVWPSRGRTVNERIPGPLRIMTSAFSPNARISSCGGVAENPCWSKPMEQNCPIWTAFEDHGPAQRARELMRCRGLEFEFRLGQVQIMADRGDANEHGQKQKIFPKATRKYFDHRDQLLRYSHLMSTSDRPVPTHHGPASRAISRCAGKVHVDDRDLCSVVAAGSVTKMLD